MRDFTRYTRDSGNAIPSDRVERAMVDYLRQTVDPSDYAQTKAEMASDSRYDDYGDEDEEDDFDADDYHGDIDEPSLSDPALARTLDPEADYMTQASLVRDDGEILHMIAAIGSNAMGCIVSSAGELVYRIYDHDVLDLDDAEDPDATEAERAALHALIFHAAEGQSVLDLKPLLAERYTEKTLSLLFGEVPTIPLVAYRLRDLPPFLIRKTFEGEIYDRLFFITPRKSQIEPLFEALRRPRIPHMQVARSVSEDIFKAAKQCNELADFIDPGWDNKHRPLDRLWCWHTCFHTERCEQVEAWLATHRFKLVPLNAFLAGMYFIKVDVGRRKLRYTSESVEGQVRREVPKVMTGIYTLNVSDKAFERFTLIDGERTLSVSSDQLEAGSLVELSFD